MANKKDKKSGSHDTMGNKPDREFEGQGSRSSPGMGSQEHQQGSGKQGQQTGRSQGNFEDDDMTTSGGRQGKFSDSESSGGDQWSPGSSQESDR